MGRRKHAIAAALLVAATAGAFVGLGATAGGQSGPWPDRRVGALWPTFSTIPSPETGAGDEQAWNGSFRRCVQSTRVSFDYACEYDDEAGNVGYACVAANSPDVAISPAAIDARVAPGDPTYGSEPPTQVCYSALAYRLSLG